MATIMFFAEAPEILNDCAIDGSDGDTKSIAMPNIVIINNNIQVIQKMRRSDKLIMIHLFKVFF